MQKTVILTKNGDPEGISQMDQDQVSRLRGKTFNSGSDKIGVIDTQQIVSEEAIQQADYDNLARQLGKSVASALRDHGDEVAFLSAKNISDKGCTIHVQYKPDEHGDNFEDDFQFGFDQDKVTLDGNEICQIGQISGTADIQKDLVKDAITKFINSKSSPDMTPNVQINKVTPQSNSAGVTECDGECGDILAEFGAAVDAYRENPHDKEIIKNLFRSARGFEGDDIAHKFKNAVEMYKTHQHPGPDGLEEPAEEVPVEEPEVAAVVSDEEPVVSPSDPRPAEATTEGITLDMALLIRLLEYAHEDAKEDVDLHFVAENLDKVAKTKGCATMEDYDQIVNCENCDSEEKSDEQPDDEESEEDVDESAESYQRYRDFLTWWDKHPQYKDVNWAWDIYTKEQKKSLEEYFFFDRPTEPEYSPEEKKILSEPNSVGFSEWWKEHPQIKDKVYAYACYSRKMNKIKQAKLQQFRNKAKKNNEQ